MAKKSQKDDVEQIEICVRHRNSKSWVGDITFMTKHGETTSTGEHGFSILGKSYKRKIMSATLGKTIEV